MASFKELMQPERIETIGSIMPELNQFVQKSDVLVMGLDNDSLFPYSECERPMCEVLDVRADGIGTEIDLKNLSSGEVFTIPKNSVQPEHLWQFEPKSFDNVVARQMEGANDGFSASGAAAAEEAPMNVEEMSGKVAFLESVIGQMAADMSERQTFDMNVTRALDRLSKDMLRLQDAKPLKFAPAFHNEYREALSDASSDGSASELSFSESESDALSESDLSESDLSESEMSSASESSEGSEFVAELLRE